MKYVCLDYDSCGWFIYLKEQDYKDNLDQTILCEECASLAVLVPNNFNIAYILEQDQLYILLQEKE